MKKPTTYEGFEPMQDRVLVAPHGSESKTDAGIILPESAQVEIFGGIVKAVGPGRDGFEMTLKVGDEVLYGQHSGFPVEIKGLKFRLIRESDAYAKTTPKK